MNTTLRTGIAGVAGAAVTVATLWITGTALADPATPTPPPQTGHSAPADPHAFPAPNRFGPGELPPREGEIPPAPGTPGHVPPHLGGPAPDGHPAPQPGAPGAPHGPASAVPGSAEGAVVGYDHGRHGEVKGLFLDDGTVVKVPPHESTRLVALAAPGDTVRADGLRHVTPHGETHLLADTVTDTATGESMSVNQPVR